MDENVHLLTDIIEESYEAGEECLKANYFGTKSTTEALVPLLHLSKSPRIVNVSSIFGELRVSNSYMHKISPRRNDVNYTFVYFSGFPMEN